MKKNIIPIILGLFVCYTTLEAAQSPIETVHSIQYAIDTQDIELFEKHVDITELLKQSIEYFFTIVSSIDNKTSLHPVLFSLSTLLSSPQCKTDITSLFVKKLYVFIQQGITSGFFAGKTSQIESEGLLPILIGEISSGKKELMVRDEEMSMQENLYPHKSFVIIPIKIKDYGKDRYYYVQLGMTRQNNIWKVTTIANVKELFKKFIEIQDNK